MAKFIQATNNFLLGEISKRAFGRTEIDQYRNACEEIRNMVVYPQGGASKKMGSIFVSSALASLSAIRLIPFVISDEISLALVLTPYTGSNKTYVFNALTGALSSSTGTGTNYAAADLAAVQYTQFDRVIVLTHPDYPPFLLQWDGSSSVTGVEYSVESPPWVAPGVGSTTAPPPERALVEELTRRRQGDESIIPFLPDNTNSAHYIRINDSGGAAPIAVTTIVSVYSEDSGGGAVNFFTSSNIGSIIKFTGAGVTGAVYLSAYIGPNEMAGFVITEVSTETRQNSWKESAWSNRRGYPKCACFYEGRLVFASTDAEPDKLWFSELNDLIEFEVTGSPSATTPFDFVLYNGKSDSVQWLAPQKQITVGTISNEIILQPSDQTTVISAINQPTGKPSTSYGSRYVQAATDGDAPVFVDRTGTRLREFVFNEAEDSYRSQSISLLAEHIFRRARDEHASYSEPAIVNLQFAKAKDPIIWAIDNNGGLVAVSRDRQYGVLAFAHMVLGGALSGEAPKVESIACVRGPDRVNDDIWMVVVRTINGSTVRYIERIGREFLGESLYNSSTSINDKPVYADSAALTILGAPGTTFTGFSHLIGQTVDVLADGEYVGQKTVSATGTITLDSNATEVIAGLNYVARIKPVPIEAGSRYQTSQGSVKRIDQVFLKLFQTGHCKIGKDENSLDEIVFREAGDSVEDPTPLFSGVKRVDLEGSYEFEKSLVVQSDKPLPLNINSIICEGVSYD